MTKTKTKTKTTIKHPLEWEVGVGRFARDKVCSTRNL